MNVSRLRPASAEERKRDRKGKREEGSREKERESNGCGCGKQFVCALLLMEMDQIISSQGESPAYLLEMQFQLISS